MKVIHPTPVEAAAIVQALHAVASAEGRLPLEPVERDSIEAIGRHLLHLAEPVEPAAQTLPADLEQIITAPVLRRETVRLMALMPIIDKKILPEKAAVVEAAARRLGIEDAGLTILRQAVRRQFRRMAFGMMSRSVAHYWSPTGKARLRDWLDMVRIALPPLPGLYALLTDKALLAKYSALANRPSNTLGYAIYHFYRQRGFPIPGEPKSFPEGWSKHEVYHIISEYETSLQGEMLNAAFSGGNTETICMDLLMLTLLQFQAGIQVMPGPSLKDELLPDAFFRAVARGIATNVDLLAGWDLWTVVDLPLDELRRKFQIPPLSSEERAHLAQSEALMAG